MAVVVVAAAIAAVIVVGTTASQTATPSGAADAEARGTTTVDAAVDARPSDAPLATVVDAVPPPDARKKKPHRPTSGGSADFYNNR